ncbi:MAG: glycosyltransferase family 2 protein [Pseudomonadota bacterium]
MAQSAHSISVIIVNYRAADVVMAHLDKTLRELDGFQSAHIFIVDNASPGDEFAELTHYVAKNNLTDRVTVVDSGGNLGFAGGNNVGFARAKARGDDFILLLNPDAYPEPGAIHRLAAFLDAAPKTAVAGAQLIDSESGEPNSCGFRFPNMACEFLLETEMDIFYRLAGGAFAVDSKTLSGPLEVDWASGAACMIRTEAISGEKLMDDNFFLYFEETDMMLNLRRQGWSVWIVPDAKVVHVGGVSTGVVHNEAEPPRLPGYWFESWRYYYRKNYGWAYAFGAALAKTGGVYLSRAVTSLSSRKSMKPQKYGADVVSKCLAPLLRGAR